MLRRLYTTSIRQPYKGLGGKLLQVNVSPSAAEKLNLLRKEDNRPELMLRVHVESGGCHGFQYVFQLQDLDKITAKDSIFERDGATVVVDHPSLQILRDATIDYTTELIGSQFKIQSPHTSSSCGCGSSFSIDPDE